MTKSQGNFKISASSLFWRISAIFMGVVVLLACVYVYLTYTTSQNYFLESTQRVNWGLATWIADHSEPFKDGEVNSEEQDKLFSKVMVANPWVEVYLLDPEGGILNYYAPDTKIKQQSVPLEPIRKFISAEESTYIEGEDPRDPEHCKVFSAAEVKEGEELVGYIYVILAGEESLRHGITSFQDLGSTFAEVDLLKIMADEGNLPAFLQRPVRPQKPAKSAARGQREVPPAEVDG